MKLSFLGQDNQVHTAKAPGEVSATEQSLKNGMEQMTGKLPGENVTGVIVDKNGNDILISIGQNRMLQAKLDGSMQIDIGRQFTFTIKSMTDGKVTLSPLFTNLTNDPNVSKALQMAGIPQTDGSVAMVKAMMGEGMPIDKNSLHQMMRNVNLHPTAKVETLVQMTRLQLPITEENIFQFEAYKNYEHQISDGIMTIADSLSETIQQLNQTGHLSEGIALYREIFSLLGREAPDQLEGEMQTLLQGEDGQGTIQHGEIPVKDTTQMLQQNFKAADAGQGVAAGSELPLTREETVTLAEDLKEVGFGELSKAVLTRQISKNDFMLALGRLLEKSPVPELAEKAGKLLESNELHKVIKQEMKNQWMLSPKEVAQENKVEELYRKLDSHLNRLSNVMEQNGVQSSFTKAVTNMTGNIDFMNQLNQMFTYVQIPLKMQGQEASGELYVYTNKKNLAKEDGEVSALLHLDMEHLGSVNVHVSMKEAKVATKFYMQDERALDLIAGHIELLNERLNRRGYQMNATFIHQEKEAGTVIEEMLQQDKNISVLAGYSFDARA